MSFRETIYEICPTDPNLLFLFNVFFSLSLIARFYPTYHLVSQIVMNLPLLIQNLACCIKSFVQDFLEVAVCSCCGVGHSDKVNGPFIVQSLSLPCSECLYDNTAHAYVPSTPGPKAKTSAWAQAICASPFMLLFLMLGLCNRGESNHGPIIFYSLGWICETNALYLEVVPNCVPAVNHEMRVK